MLTKIHKLWFVTLLTIFCFAGCIDLKPEEEIIPLDEMTALLFDYHVAYTHGDKVMRDFRMREIYVHELIDGILKQRGLSREDFYRSYEYYVAHPILLDTIYSRIMVDMQAVQNDPSFFK